MKLPKQAQPVLRNADERNRQKSTGKQIESKGVLPSSFGPLDLCDKFGIGCPYNPYPPYPFKPIII